jgi:hypothetical protein
MFEATMLPRLDVRHISSAHLNHFSIQDRKEVSMVIDVIEMQNLRKFIQGRLRKEIREIEAQWSKSKEKYLSLIKKIRDRYMPAKNKPT